MCGKSNSSKCIEQKKLSLDIIVSNCIGLGLGWFHPYSTSHYHEITINL